MSITKFSSTTANEYVIKYATDMDHLTNNWAQISEAARLSHKDASSKMNVTFKKSNFNRNTIYYVALKSKSRSGIESKLSNIGVINNFDVPESEILTCEEYFDPDYCTAPPELAAIKLTTKDGISCGGYYLFAQICSAEQNGTCCEEEIVKNGNTGFEGGEIIQTKLQNCTDFIDLHIEEDLTIKLEGWNELTKNSHESFCPADLEIHLEKKASLMATFEDKRVKKTPKVNLLVRE
jgi:hypothetical protein